MTGVISPGDAFLEWGWRIPFLLSVVLIGVGYWVRRTVEDTPVFQEIQEESAKRKAPILVLFKKHLPSSSLRPSSSPATTRAAT